MSIKAYVGRMGSGKTYEVVSSVILQALGRGRRVVSNVAGLDYGAMRELLISDGVPADRVGELVQVEHAAVLEPQFWRTDKDDADGVDSFIKGGDLVALDEIWRFWDGFADRKMPERVMNFYRMHRHFAHPVTGVTCDVALITQDVLDIARRVRAVIEETYYMEKLTAVGSTKRYRVDVFQGTRTTRRPLRQLQRSYDPRYFPLYSSHSQRKEGDAEAVEENIDGRGNVLKGALFKLVLPAGVVVMGFAIWIVWGFFHPKPAAVPVASKEGAQPGAAAGVSQAKPSAAGSASVSDEWRAGGYSIGRDGVSIYLFDGRVMRTLRNPPSYRLHPTDVEVALPGGQVVTSWSGAKGVGIVPGATK